MMGKKKKGRKRETWFISLSRLVLLDGCRVISLYRPDKLEAVENTRSHIEASQFTQLLKSINKKGTKKKIIGITLIKDL